jgi:hypothetical protein
MRVAEFLQPVHCFSPACACVGAAIISSSIYAQPGRRPRLRPYEIEDPQQRPVRQQPAVCLCFPRDSAGRGDHFIEYAVGTQRQKSSHWRYFPARQAGRIEDRRRHGKYDMRRALRSAVSHLVFSS